MTQEMLNDLTGKGQVQPAPMRTSGMGVFHTAKFNNLVAILVSTLITVAISFLQQYQSQIVLDNKEKSFETEIANVKLQMKQEDANKYCFTMGEVKGATIQVSPIPMPTATPSAKVLLPPVQLTK